MRNIFAKGYVQVLGVLPVGLICRSCASRLRLHAKQISSQCVVWAHVRLRLQSLSSSRPSEQREREPGPIRRGGNYLVSGSMAFFNNPSLWLWAFAGTTMDRHSGKEPAPVQLPISKCVDWIEPRRAPRWIERREE